MMNPRDLQNMMKQLNQMGLKQETIEASRVIIECPGEKIVIDDPSVMEIVMHGQASYQISGKVSKVQEQSAEDVQLVMEQAGVSKEAAEKALKEANGDLAKAILNLKGEE